MKTIFISFADSRMLPSLKRIKQQAHEMEIFDEIIIFTEKQLDNDFVEKHKDRLKLGSRGYGYWIWKPYIIKKILETMDEGDRLLYIDAGCHLNPKGINRLREYFQTVSDSQLKVGGFQIGNSNNDKTWTKMDLLAYFKVQNNNDIINSGQIAGGHVIIQKCESVVKFVEEWINISENLHLIDDSPSLLPNFPEFREHRHDQSIFSLLCKTKGAVIFSSSECWAESDKDWNTLIDYPIWDKRDKQFSLKTRIKATIKSYLRKAKKILKKG